MSIMITSKNNASDCLDLYGMNTGNELGRQDDMHFVWFSMRDGFFSPRVSESRQSRVATRVGFGDEW